MPRVGDSRYPQSVDRLRKCSVEAGGTCKVIVDDVGHGLGRGLVAVPCIVSSQLAQIRQAAWTTIHLLGDNSVIEACNEVRGPVAPGSGGIHLAPPS